MSKKEISGPENQGISRKGIRRPEYQALKKKFLMFW